jgi:TolA-binding protein
MYRIASLYKKCGQSDKAQTRFEKLALNNPGEMTGGIYYHLGEIYFQKGINNKARQMFRYCLDQIPGHQKARIYLDKLNGNPA